MDKIKAKIQELVRINNADPILAEYIENDIKLESGLLCRTAEFTDNPDIFYLITDVRENYCEIIPGSFDYHMAGLNDIILPKNITGNFTFLSLDMAATVDRKSIGKVFARLDKQTYNRVIDSQIEYETGEKGEVSSFPFAALPYASEHDPRVTYHKNISDIIRRAQSTVEF